MTTEERETTNQNCGPNPRLAPANFPVRLQPPPAKSASPCQPCSEKAMIGSWTAEEGRAASRGHTRPNSLSLTSRGWLPELTLAALATEEDVDNLGLLVKLKQRDERERWSWGDSGENKLRGVIPSELTTWPVLIGSSFFLNPKVYPSLSKFTQWPQLFYFYFQLCL